MKKFQFGTMLKYLLVAFLLLVSVCLLAFKFKYKHSLSTQTTHYENTKYGFGFDYPSDKKLQFHCGGDPKICSTLDQNLSTTRYLGLVGGDVQSKTYFPTAISVTDNTEHLSPSAYAQKYFGQNQSSISYTKVHNHDVLFHYSSAGDLNAVVFFGDKLVTFSPIDSDPATIYEQREFLQNIIYSLSFK